MEHFLGYFIVSSCIIFLSRVATSEKCYLQSPCGHDQLAAIRSTDCEGKVGSVIELHCSFNRTNDSLSLLPVDWTFQWQKAGNTLCDNSKTIRFTPFNHSDAGNYQCMAFNGSHEVFCGQIALTTAPFPGNHCTENNNGNYNCGCIQYVHVDDGCEQLLTVNVAGYPPPNITWFVGNTLATNDNQSLLTILPNGSARVDVQLWSLANYKYSISSIARNEVSAVGICVWRNWTDPDWPPSIYFNQSAIPLQLKEGASDAIPITCETNTNIGSFYICYSSNLHELERLEINNSQCCYCSSKASDICKKNFPNWHVEHTGTGDRSICLVKLKNVVKDNSGFYQCRVYSLSYPCKRRYGNIYNCSVSTSDNSSSSKLNFIGFIIIACVTITFIVLMILAGIAWSHRKKSHSLNGSQDGSDDSEVCQPLLDSSVNENQTPPVISVEQQLIVAPRISCSHGHKAHVMHFDEEDAREWVNNHLIEILRQMNVEEEHAIAGRLWSKEISRMIGEGYKVIVVITNNIITKNHFETTLQQIIVKQNCRQPCLIPITFNCTLQNYDELKPYVVLSHDQPDLYDRLKQAICDQCHS